MDDEEDRFVIDSFQEEFTLAVLAGAVFMEVVLGLGLALFVALGLVVFDVRPTHAQEGGKTEYYGGVKVKPHPDMSIPGARDPYRGIKNKDGVLCCSGDDCKQALKEELFDILPGGGYRIRSTGEFVGEPQVANSPDGNWHICRRADTKKTVRCLMIPQGGV